MKAESLVVRNVRVSGGEHPTDIVVADGRIAALGPSGQVPLPGPGVPVEDGAGALAIPGLIDAHAHLDKTLWGTPWVPHSAGPALADRIANGQTRREELGLPSPATVRALLHEMVRQGTTAVRTHTDVDPDVGLVGVEVVADAAADLAGLIDVHQVAFPQGGMLTRPGTVELLEQALRAGVPTVGGLDPSAVDRDAVRHLDTLFVLAERHGAGIDIHLHERGTLGAHAIELVIERTARFGLQGRVALSHAVAIVDVDEAAGDRLAHGLAENDISLITATVYNTPVMPVERLAALGVNLASGNDGIRDLWGPYGSGDMLERAYHLAYRNGFRRDEQIAAALDTAVGGGARALGREPHAVAVGSPADFFLVDAAGAAEAVVCRPPRLLVVKGGRVVARAGRA
jgi:cytosine deaminase